MNKIKQKSISLLIFGGILFAFYFLNPEARDITAFTDNLNRSLKIDSCIPASSLALATSSPSSYQVLNIIDGDTIEVQTPDCAIERVRMIGINTPEAVDPRRPVQCFGKEASKKAKEILGKRIVILEKDPMQGERDKYGRILAYVFLQDGTSFNKLMIEEGYAYEYTYQTAYKYQKEFKEAEVRALENLKGLWALSACAGKV